MIRIVASFQLKPGNVDKMLEYAKPLIEQTRKEKGCVHYDLARSDKDENLLVILEAWEDQACLDSHSASAHFAEYVPKIGALCEGGAAVVDKYTQVI